ncbi:MAG: hypothetical protein KR126chlam4_00411 [Candidatus Anoxychlamydiales bacterium]|nr:hypothetical protein [Candidatus Anoxychlamydiales bacterium]NGX40589.1 hypothetical protein [Candidatus Anoxychlamydiales bacterium]HEU64281.1 hypothetical protein [Chlamydiota bacterium]
MATPPLPRMYRETFGRMFPSLTKQELGNTDKNAREIFLALLKLQQLLQAKLKFPNTPIVVSGHWTNPIEKKQNENTKIIIRPESKEEGFNDLKYFINNLKSYKKNGYKITLPNSISLKNLYNNPNLLSKNEQLYRSIFYKKIYDLSLYLKDFKEIFLAQNILEKAAEKLQILNKNWGFKIFEKYEIVLSLSGSDVRYNIEKKQIFYLATPKDLKKTIPCYETIIHEMVHIGIDQIIVGKYNLNHLEKERLVDLICMIYLKDLLPNYTEQDIKDNPIDEFIDENSILDNLPLAIAKFVEKYPRK